MKTLLRGTKPANSAGYGMLATLSSDLSPSFFFLVALCLGLQGCAVPFFKPDSSGSKKESKITESEVEVGTIDSSQPTIIYSFDADEKDDSEPEVREQADAKSKKSESDTKEREKQALLAEQARLEQERIEQKRQETRAEQERLDRERLEKERQERERLVAAKREKEKLLEQKRLEEQRLAQAALEAANAKAAKERAAMEKAEKEAREQEALAIATLEREEREKQARLEQAARQAELVRQQQIQAQRERQLELEKQAELVKKSELAKKAEQERLAKAKLEKERLEKERLAQLRLEQERIEKVRIEQEKLAKQKLESERLAQVKKQEEAERIKAAKLQAGLTGAAAAVGAVGSQISDSSQGTSSQGTLPQNTPPKNSPPTLAFKPKPKPVISGDRVDYTKIVGKFVSVPSGKFKMGDLTGRGRSSERPVRSVQVKSFYIMEHEVPYKAWDACVKSGGCSYSPPNDVHGRGQQPVSHISYKDIVDEFIPWLKKETGVDFRLPSEAEWEYAARAGTQTDFSWGDKLACDQLRYNAPGCGQSGPAAVKSYLPNSFGLYNVNGNLWEWTEDCWQRNYRGAPANQTARKKDSCNRAPVRGGSWFHGKGQLRTASRVKASMDKRYFNVGFRLVMEK